MQVSTNTFYRRQTETLADLKAEVAHLQEEIATGKQVSAPSDDPIAFSEMATLKGRLARIDQYKSAIGAAHQRIANEESAMQQVSNVLTRIQELALQSANDTQSAADRKTAGKEVEGLSQTLLQLANTQDADGSSLFGGFRTRQPAFAADANGAIVYQGDDGTIEAAIEDGTQMAVNASGQDVFMSVRTADGATKSVFDIVKGALDQLAAGKSPAASSQDLAAALDHVTGWHASAGARLARLDTQSDVLDQTKLAAQTRLSALEDTDIESTVSKLKQKIDGVDASQAAFARISSLSLFNYLK